ncbi:hypothetical protein TNCV_2613691 [Trichonephila clavipes]|nr:hypothetical protein TNCV_2613691 [Trichonephila clavipes]
MNLSCLIRTVQVRVSWYDACSAGMEVVPWCSSRVNNLEIQGRSYHRTNNTGLPNYKDPNRCIYIPTNRAPISKKGPQRNFDTAPPEVTTPVMGYIDILSNPV